MASLDSFLSLFQARGDVLLLVLVFEEIATAGFLCCGILLIAKYNCLQVKIIRAFVMCLYIVVRNDFYGIFEIFLFNVSECHFWGVILTTLKTLEEFL